MRDMSSCAPAALRAGTRPNMTPVRRVTKKAKAKTRRSISKLCRNAANEIPRIGLSAAKTGISQFARITPAAPPSKARSMLSLASDAARQLQIRHIGATNQQKKSDATSEREQRFANVTFQIAKQVLTKQDSLDAPSTPKIGIFLLQLSRNRF